MKVYLNIILALTAFIGLAQEKSPTDQELSKEELAVEAIASEACTCLNDTSLTAARQVRYQNIEECIENASILKQSTDGLMKTLGVDTDSISNTIEINISKYKIEVERALLERCPRMKLLMSSDNVASKSSMSENKKALEAYEAGNKLYAQENYKEAIQFFKQAVKYDKRFAFAWDNLGLAYRKNGDYKKAIAAYNKSIALDPTGRVPLMNKPIAYLMNEQVAESVTAYKEYIAIFPNDPEGYYGIARSYMSLEQVEPALDNIFNAFVKYNEIKSPYARDAEQVISQIYQYLKANNNLDLWKKYTKKYNITVGN